MMNGERQAAGRRRRVTGPTARRSSTNRDRWLFHLGAGVPALLLGLASIYVLYLASERGLFGAELADIGGLLGGLIAVIGGAGVWLSRKVNSRILKFALELVSMVGVVLGLFAMLIGLSS